jgi:hypothetical protein
MRADLPAMKTKSLPPKPHPAIEVVRVVWLAIFISVFSFFYYYRHGDVLLYGDAVAHINIARRVFDSKTPGFLQLGTVWLPLPHLLIMPFVLSKQMWQSGSGGSIPSMAAYIFGVMGIFRLVRTALQRADEVNPTAKLGAWLVALLYAANPNLIYMQATAMGESLYLAFFIWAVVYFAEFTRGTPKAPQSLMRCGWCLAAACLSRYDGWFLAVILGLMALLHYLQLRNSPETVPVAQPSEDSRNPVPLSAIVKFALIAAAGPILWLSYNAAVYENPLEFANGPYSAKAIEYESATVNPAKANLFAAASYFLKSAELNVGEANWQGRLWLLFAIVGSAVAWFGRDRTVLLLWVPLPFYALSVAYGSVPIFLPMWWPFSNYNVRYGLQLLPAFAVFVPLGISFFVQSAIKVRRIPPSWLQRTGAATVCCILLLAAVSYGAIWRADPICYREASVNSRGRMALDDQIARWIKPLPSDSTLLMYLGQHAAILEQSGIPLKRDIYEGNHRVWKQPSDPDGLWERALADPAAYADYIIGFDGDPVWKAAQYRHLNAIVEIHTTGQPRAAVFQGGTQASR